MPKFVISCWVNNTGTTTVSAHVGASLVSVANNIEYYNVNDDIKKDFPPGKTWVKRYLNSDLGPIVKYDFLHSTLGRREGYRNRYKICIGEDIGSC